jgi:hypothetical protein
VYLEDGYHIHKAPYGKGVSIHNRPTRNSFRVSGSNPQRIFSPR